MEFIISPKNGYWGLAKDELSRNCLLQKLEQRPLMEGNYKGIQVIALNSTAACNLGCIYCSTAKKRRYENMPFETAKQMVDLSRELEHTPQILFHGSEPLINFDLIKRTVLYEKSTRDEKNKRLEFCVQSNLTLLSPEIVQFFKENNVAVSTSLDGREEEHNFNRPYLDGRGSYQKVVQNISEILKFQKGMCAVCVTTSKNVNSLSEITIDFEKRGITEVQFLPAIPTSSEKCEFLPSNEDLSKEYIRLFEQTIQRTQMGEQRIAVKCLSQYLSDLFFNTGIDSCRMCTPSQYHPLLAVDMRGDVYPCDLFWGDKTVRIGNIFQGSLVSMVNSKNSLRKQPIETTACSPCDWRKICGGGCMADRNSSKPNKPHYCETHKKVFEYISGNLQKWIQDETIKKIFEQEKRSGRLT